MPSDAGSIPVREGLGRNGSRRDAWEITDRGKGGDGEGGGGTGQAKGVSNVINAAKEKLRTFFQGNLRYVVPFFQRPYVWNGDNWIVSGQRIAGVP